MTRVRPALLLAAALALSGCFGGLGSAPDAPAGAHAPRRATVLGSFAVEGPEGFCIDRGATRESDESAFVLLGSCSAISGNPKDAHPRAPAVLTASVARAGALDPAALGRMADFLRSEAGRAALGRAGAGGPAELIDLEQDGALVLVHAREEAPADAMAAEYWRAVFGAGEALVTVTVSGFAETPLSARAGEKLVRAFAEAIRAANGAAPPPPANPVSGLLSRLF